MNKIELHDPSTRTCVFPLHTRYGSPGSKIEKLKQIGFSNIEKIEMPIYFWVTFVKATYPENFHCEEDDAGVLGFNIYDEKDRDRVSVDFSFTMDTKIATRYFVATCFDKKHEIIDSQYTWIHILVVDSEESGEELTHQDYDLDCGGKIIWKRTKKFKTFEDADADGEKWLDEHYPDWKNPAAYWI